MSLSWPWHFVTVSETEKQNRRELLDLRGYYAQLSILIAISLLRLYRVFYPVDQRREQPVKGSRQKSWLDSPPFAGWVETRKQYIVCLLWFCWLFSLSIWGTGDDYLHLTKALGHVGLSQLPLQMAMSPVLYISTSTPRSSSLVSLLTSIPQPTLTAYHRLFGRVVVFPLLAGHAVLYLLFFAQSSYPGFESLLAKRILDSDVQSGLAAVGMATALLIFMRPKGATSGIWRGSMKARRRSFYIVHVLLVGLLCLAAYSHVAQAQVFILEALGCLTINLACCYMTAH